MILAVAIVVLMVLVVPLVRVVRADGLGHRAPARADWAAGTTVEIARSVAAHR
ncbi:hypothetical protein Celgi_1406 [Cellulomonas gilvus ATCC 13127]|uniref:Uncharacterized protein n=1 Tax=Cellulomonas gilvus (strain ATCC 13127 / NRRL B-14078) TaxID=593907 RepID=F8A3M2_CELGA|nr:hypothetical protein Celgi_1406 [Cellulomonas gilvus ATCC 13127]